MVVSYWSRRLSKGTQNVSPVCLLLVTPVRNGGGGACPGSQRKTVEWQQIGLDGIYPLRFFCRWPTLLGRDATFPRCRATLGLASAVFRTPAAGRYRAPPRRFPYHLLRRGRFVWQPTGRGPLECFLPAHDSASRTFPPTRAGRDEPRRADHLQLGDCQSAKSSMSVRRCTGLRFQELARGQGHWQRQSRRLEKVPASLRSDRGRSTGLPWKSRRPARFAGPRWCAIAPRGGGC